MGRQSFDGTFDADLQYKDAGLVAASAAAQVSAAAKIVNLGAARSNLTMRLYVSAIEIASNDELYTILVQGSSSATFASDIVNLAGLPLGATEVAPGGANDAAIGWYELPYTNEHNGTIFPYTRLYTLVEGSIATGINYEGYAVRSLAA